MRSVDRSVEIRVHSDAEVAFSAMRVLAIARLLWPQSSGLQVELLASIADVPLDELRGAIARLCDEGVAILDSQAASVRLSDRGVHELLRGDGALLAPVDTAAAPAPTP